MSQHDAHQMRLSVIRKSARGRCTNRVDTWKRVRRFLTNVQTDYQHTMVEYQALGVDAKNAAKDVGSYVLGHFKDNIRKRDNVQHRDGIALDIDEITPLQFQDVKAGFSPLCQYEFLAVTSRSHTLLKPKWRLIFPVKRLISSEEFTAVSRILASTLLDNLNEAMEAVDDVSFRVAQIMYLPSKSKDGIFESFLNEGRLVDPDELLKSWPNWQDYTTLPYSSRGMKRPGQAAPAERPNEKQNIVGAFCRAYTVPEAIATFLPETYVNPTRDGRKTRYTYAKGSGSNGAVVEDDGLFLYSHHGSDPCADRLVNAFDLVRIHLYGDRDPSDDESSPMRKASFKAMRERAMLQAPVQRESRRMQDERLDAAFVDLDDDATLKDDDVAEEQDDTDFDLLGSTPTKKVNGHSHDLDDLLGGSTDETSDEDDILAIGTASKKDVKLDKDGIPQYVKHFNERHAIVRLKSKTRVAVREKDGTISFMEKGQFFDFNANAPAIQKPNSSETYTTAQAWFAHDFADRYEGVVFEPTVDDPDVYNMWRGFSCEPDDSKSCKLWLSHLKNLICDGNEVVYNWIIQWFAHIIQNPGQKLGTSVVLRGDEGCGKDILFEYFAKIIENYHFRTSERDQVFGKFNNHMHTCLLLHMEEGFWHGEKNVDSKLKSLISSVTMPIEPKGVDAHQVRNFTRLCITSNEEIVIPAGPTSRRYLMLDVSGRMIHNRAYWEALGREMKNGGPEALMAFLLTVDVDETVLRRAPDTDALETQKAHRLINFDAYWGEILTRGELPVFVDFVDEDATELEDWTTGRVTIQKSAIRDSYLAWMKQHNYQGKIKTETEIGLTIKRLCPDVGSIRLRNGNDRPTGYRFPSLAECRQTFKRATGVSITDVQADFGPDETDILQ